MEINKIYFKFKICISLEEYKRAVAYLDSISNYIEELTQEDVDMLRRLKKGVLKHNRKYLLSMRTLREEELSKNTKYQLKVVLDEYSSTLHSESLNLVENLINCVNNLITKVKEFELIAIMNEIRAKLFTFLCEFNYEEKSKYLQLAYGSYKKSVEICLKHLDKKDTIRIKVLYSYCKFLFTFLEDKYRSVLFCINLMDEMHQIEVEESENDEDERVSVTNEFQKIEKKLKLFYDNNLEEYNKAIRVYHPEYKI